MNRKSHQKQREIRQQCQKEKMKADLKLKRREIDFHSRKYHELLLKSEEASAELDYLLESHPKFATASFQQKIIYICILFVLPCAYIFNVLLIYSPAEYLIEQSLGNSLLAKPLTLLVPIVFVAFEIGLSTLVYMVKDRDE